MNVIMKTLTLGGLGPRGLLSYDKKNWSLRFDPGSVDVGLVTDKATLGEGLLCVPLFSPVIVIHISFTPYNLSNW